MNVRLGGGRAAWCGGSLQGCATIWRRLADASAQNRGVTYSVAKLRQGSCRWGFAGGFHLLAAWGSLLISCKPCTWLLMIVPWQVQCLHSPRPKRRASTLINFVLRLAQAPVQLSDRVAERPALLKYLLLKLLKRLPWHHCRSQFARYKQCIDWLSSIVHALRSGICGNLTTDSSSIWQSSDSELRTETTSTQCSTVVAMGGGAPPVNAIWTIDCHSGQSDTDALLADSCSAS